MSQTRKSGYYRVKFAGEWFIARYISEDTYWNIPGYMEYFDACEFETINENPINPEPDTDDNERCPECGCGYGEHKHGCPEFFIG